MWSAGGPASCAGDAPPDLFAGSTRGQVRRRLTEVD
jgi:hypothetical protein